ncbi:RHS repeat protein [Xanthomonas citri pv. malvacearum]|nr:RHS repeat protein [Xanthomonas citri]WAW97476.1 RHS repeat protein [Xanthomonas citri pv. malvacearum]
MGVVVVLGMACGQALAQDDAKAPWEEYDKLIGKRSTIAALGPTLLGDQVDLVSGALSFRHADVELPGNDALPVALARTFQVDVRTDVPYHDLPFADWDLDVPRLSGSFASDWPDARCAVPSVEAAAPPTVQVGDKYFYAPDYWHGLRADMPGGGEMLVLGQDGARPASGGPYYWTTAYRTVFACLGALKNGSGQGFLATTADGTRYWFDWMAQYHEPSLKGTVKSGATHYLARRTNVLYATRIEDRHGNWVTYDYANAWNAPARLTAITSGDGRRMTLAYNGSGQIQSVSAGTRTWSYAYSGSGVDKHLASVTLPDGSQWRFDLAALSNALIRYEKGQAGDPVRACGDPGGVISGGFSGSVTHPSGAVGTFAVQPWRHGRSNVPRVCNEYTTPSNDPNDDVAVYPWAYDAFSLVNKTLSGPGVAPLQWQYDYTAQISFAPGTGPVCTSGNCAAPTCLSDDCAGTAVTTVTAPSGEWTRYTHGNSYRYNEGKLLKVERGAASAASASVTTTSYALAQTGMPYVQPIARSPQWRGDGFVSEYPRPENKTVIVQDGTTYQAVVNAFDGLARALSVTRSGPGGNRTDATEYYDHLSRWVLGQTAKVTNGDSGRVVSQVGYDDRALPVQRWAFGKLQQTLSYNADGTVATVKDGNNATTTLSSWKRGMPQAIAYADGSTVSASVDDNGWIASATDENGYVTRYGYDVMGRIASIAYPDGDSSAWNATTQSFQQVAGTEYGLGAGHWRQTVATGNARKETYFDAFWQPIVTREYDLAAVGATQRFQRFAYDHAGRQVFASYAGANDALSTGVWTGYDALGRTTSVSQDSELGLLTTLTDYLAGNRTRVTGPRGQQTLTSYQAFDQPVYDAPVAIQHPEGAFTEIARDVFGKPLSLRRRNADQTQSVTRSYVYDDMQQVCKTIEPETGATANGYDAAGNLVWSAGGLALPSPTACDTSTAYASGRRVDRSYDARNRIRSLTFPDGNGNQTWNYTSDGLPTQIVTANDGGASQIVNTYGYNKRRLLVSESLQQSGGALWSLGYGYDANGALSGITYPSGLYVDYAPNALGQPTQAGPYATAVRYYPNGGMQQFAYGNGLVHGMTQNARQLPARVVDGGGVLDNSYDYDASGNVARIGDALDGARTRTMEYDTLERLTKTSSSAFGGDGVMRYSYDALDNVRSAKLLGRKEHNYWYDANNRLSNVTTDSGATTVGLSYDAQGNLSNKNGQQFTFDLGNRLREAVGKEGYRYDGHGRRVQSGTAGGSRILSFYGQDGVLRRQNNEPQGKTIEYVSLNGSLVAKLTTVVAPVTPTLSVPSYSSNGSYTVSWNAVTFATSYELQEQANGGAWSGTYSGASQTWSASGKPGGSYSYRVRACQAAACSGWSAAATATVQLPPSSAPVLTAPAQAPNGTYTVGWSGPAGADTYRLEESVNGGGWSEVQSAAATSRAYTGKPAGTYAYRARGCNPAGCGPYSGTTTVQAFYPPGGTPSLSAPGQSLGGSYTVAWSAVSGAASYRLEESANGGGWTQVQETATTSTAFSGKAAGNYGYRARACNGAGCGGYSGTATVSVLYPPSGAPSLTVPGSSSTGNYTVSWSGVATVDSYRLEEQVNGGGWSEVQNAASTSWGAGGKGNGTYGYRARGCNAAGCGPYSGSGSVQVSLPPPIPAVPGGVAASSYWDREVRPAKRYNEVIWNAVGGATAYEVQAQPGSAAASIYYRGADTNYRDTLTATPLRYWVRACNSSGCSAWSGMVQP